MGKWVKFIAINYFMSFQHDNQIAQKYDILSIRSKKS